jgi:hypothetical protein
MKSALLSIYQQIASLRDSGAMIRRTPALWPLWWPVLCACEAEAARLERRLTYLPEPAAHTRCAEVIDLEAWRRSKAATLASHRQRGGSAHRTAAEPRVHSSRYKSDGLSQGRPNTCLRCFSSQ